MRITIIRCSVSEYPRSEMQFEAHLLGLQAKLRKYQGADYDGSPLEEAKTLVKQLRSQFAGRLPNEEKERLRTVEGQLNLEIATRDYRMAEYFDNTKYYGAARHYYAEVIKKYPDTDLAKQARERMAQIGGEPEKPPKRLAWFVDLFPESSERSRVARIPELQNGGTRLAQPPAQSTTTIVLGVFSMLTIRKTGRIAKHQLQANSSPFYILHFAFCILQFCLTGCAGYQVGAGSLYAPDVTTVYVPMIESDSYRRDLGERLTEAVIKEIELKTPYKVVDTPDADSVLSARLTRDTRRTLVENAFDDPRRFGKRAACRSHLAESTTATHRPHAVTGHAARSGAHQPNFQSDSRSGPIRRLAAAAGH